MGLFDWQWLGVRGFIWGFLLAALFLGGVVVIYWFREILKEKWYKLRWPEKVIKVRIIYPGRAFKTFWRLIPEGNDFSIDGRTYHYNSKDMLKDNPAMYAAIGEDKDADKLSIWVEGKRYILDLRLAIKRRWSEYPEIDYLFDVPYPLDYGNIDKGKIQFSASEVEQFKRQDLFGKLLTLEGEKSLIIIAIAAAIIAALASLVNLAKTMGWLK
jgi:hypothetical protein